MRFVLALFLCLAALPVLAQDKAAPAAAAMPPAAFPLWRSDSALDSAAALINDKKYSEALLILDTVVLRNMRNADAHVYSAVAWANLGNLQKAKTILANAFAIDKGHLGAYVIGGLIALREGNHDQAGYYLGAIKTVCQGELCPEFQALKKAITEAK